MSLALLRALLAVPFGACLGSFLNVVIYRVPNGESIVRPGSACPCCDTALRPYELVPVISWLALRGHCRTCGIAIGIRYPAVEALTAAMFAAVAYRFERPVTIIAYMVLVAACIALSVIDLDTHRLPTALVHLTAAVGASALIAASVDVHQPARLAWAAAGAVAVGGTLFGIWWIAPGGMGFGDVRYGATLAMFVGWLGMAYVFVGLVVAFFAGAVGGLGLIATGRAGRRSAVPFGPFLSVGALVAVFAGPQITQWWLPAR